MEWVSVDDDDQVVAVGHMPCRRRELGETQSYVSDRLLRMEEVLESSTKREEGERREVEWRVWWVRLD